jgi:hypothetical protein
MRRNYLIAAALFSGLAFAQQPVQFPEADAQIGVHEGEDILNREAPVAIDGMETTIWSEDFSGGVPTSWSNLGLSLTGTPRPNAEWEYRGPTTNPDTSVGSRGWLAGGSSSLPPLSPTRANGFMIYDSDYKETGGTGLNQGDAPGGHIGVLITDVINLTGENDVMLEFYSFARLFNSRLYVAFSTNGGTSFPDTIEIHPPADLGVNAVTPRDFRVLENVSQYIGGESNVKMAIIFKGDERPGAAAPAPPTGSPHGLYFWMIDDISLKALPSSFFTFESTQVTTATGTQDVPAFDIINQNTATSWGNVGHYGITTLNQVRPIAFDANLRNFGRATQTNIALAVEVWRNGALDTVVSHTPEPIMTPGELKDFTFFTTDFWTPTQAGDYRFVYKVTSDSLDLAGNNSNTIGYRPDSVAFLVVDQNAPNQLWGMDYRRFNNGLGTGQLGDDGSAIAARYDIVQGEVDAIWSARVGLSAATEAGAEIEVEIYKVEDFLTAQAGGSIGFAFKTITQTDIDNGFVDVDFYDATQGVGDIPIGWTPAQNDSAVWAVVTMFSNNGSFPVSIRNDQTFQNTTQSLMFDSDQGNWFNGYSGSRGLAQPHIRLNMEGVVQTNSVTSVENDLGLSYYPNPTSGRLVLDFKEKHGKFANIRVMDMSGKTVHTERANTTNISQHQVELGNLSSGMYIMSVEMGGKQSTFKVTVEK